jgi:amidohydrolase
MSTPAPSPLGIRDHLDELIAIRRDIHAHPELGMEELRTAALVAEKLRAWGIETTEGVGKLGVVGTIKGKLPGQRAIGLRADMDALPIIEQTGLPHASTSPGRMHACGHDGHTTMLLGAARHLIENPDFSGTVHLIFQPAEEGRGGAEAMLADGLFKRFPCDAVYGLHNMPGVPVGHFETRKGALMAGGGSWRVRFSGTGGHGGMPHHSVDLSLVQAHFVLGLQTIMTRNMSAFASAVITVGHIAGGAAEATNVMPAEITVSGTMRYFDPKMKSVIETRIRELAQQCATLHGATADVSYTWMAVPLINHDAQTTVAAEAAMVVVGGDAVNAQASAVTAGEDFSYMLAERPGAFMFIGNGSAPDGTVHHCHTPMYDFNDAIIPLGVGYWVELVKQELKLAV